VDKVETIGERLDRRKTQSLSAAILCLEGSTQEGYYGLIYWSIDEGLRDARQYVLKM
jgi:hypothetical protein